MPGERIRRLSFAREHVESGEALARELVGKNLTGAIDRCPCPVDRRRSFWIPAGRLCAGVLNTYGPAHGLRQDGGVHRRIAGIVATVGARPGHPDGAHVFYRHAQHGGDTIARVVRLLRTCPQGRLSVLYLDNGTGGPHARVRLEWPFVFGLDDACGGFERFFDVTGFLAADFVLAHWGAADVIVKRGLVRKRWLGVRPFHLELLCRLDCVPLLVGDDAEEPFLPHHPRPGDVPDGAFVDLHRHAAGDGGPDHAAMHHLRPFDVGAEIRLRIDLGRDVLARDWLTDDPVLLPVLRLCLARSIERVIEFLVPVELDVEVTPADELGVR